jgi:hypothetical protein
LQDTQYFSDSEHHLMSGGLASHQRQEMRRLRNRTLTGLETLRLVEQEPILQNSVSAENFSEQF